MTVRRATSSDFEAVARLLTAAALPVAGVQPSLTDFYVAVENGRVLGAIGLEVYGCDAVLRSAVVDSVARGGGIGVALVERILEHASARGIQGVYLLTTTAEEYFPRFGFQRITRELVPERLTASIEFREACPASAVAMRKVLEPANPIAPGS